MVGCNGCYYDCVDRKGRTHNVSLNFKQGDRAGADKDTRFKKPQPDNNMQCSMWLNRLLHGLVCMYV